MLPGVCRCNSRGGAVSARKVACTAGKSGKIPYGRIKKYFRESSTLVSTGRSTGSSASTDTKVENLKFYYHPDHLGSSSYITDASGEVYQHEEYFPLGELRS